MTIQRHANTIERAHMQERARGHLYELEMVSAECRTPLGFRKACIPHQYIMFMIFVVKTVKTKQKSHKRKISSHKTSQEIEKGTIDSFESDISTIVWCDTLRNNFVWCTRQILYYLVSFQRQFDLTWFFFYYLFIYLLYYLRIFYQRTTTIQNKQTSISRLLYIHLSSVSTLCHTDCPRMWQKTSLLSC